MGNVKIFKFVWKNIVVFLFESIYGFCFWGWKIDRYDSDYLKLLLLICFYLFLKMIVLYLKEDVNYIDFVKRWILELDNGRGVFY